MPLTQELLVQVLSEVTNRWRMQQEEKETILLQNSGVRQLRLRARRLSINDLRHLRDTSRYR